MILELDEDEIRKLKSNGFKITASSEKTEKVETDYLKDISITLDAILRKEAVVPKPPTINVASPAVVVSPPEVIVNTPEICMIKKWNFELLRGNDGKLKRIIATAAD